VLFRGFDCLLSQHFQWVVSSYVGIDLLACEFSMLDDHFRSVPAVVLQVEATRAAMLSFEGLETFCDGLFG